MKLLLLDTCEATRSAVRAAATRGHHELTVMERMDESEPLCGDLGVEAVLVSPEFFSCPEKASELMSHCDSAYHAVVLLVDSVSELGELGDSARRVIDDYLLKPVDEDALVARLDLVRARRAHRSRERAILAALPDLVFRFDRDGHYLDFHAPHESQLFVPPEQVIGSTLDSSLPPEVATRARAALEATIDSGEPREFEYSVPVGDAITHWESRMVRSGPGEALAIVRNISEQKRILEQLHRSKALARAFATSILHLQETERQRLSRELHDAIGQMLLVHRMDVELIEKNATSAGQRDAAAALERSLESTLDMVRSLAFGLRPPQLDDLGLGSALKALVRELVGRAGLATEYSIEADAAMCRGDVGVVLYRIAQEALTNAVRHAACANIIIELRKPSGSMTLAIEDDGKGIDPMFLSSSPAFRSGKITTLGVVGMRERAELLGGSLQIVRGSRGGTRIVATIPPQTTSGVS